MPSDPGRTQRLHPLSLLFSIGSAARGLLLPGIAVLFFSGGSNYEFWLMIFFIPAAISAVVKYVAYSYRLGDDEMMVREGVLTRNERHIPYARIQNVNLVQNPFHRMFGVAEVHLETASGSKPEAIIRVLSLSSIDTIRDLVFRERDAGTPGDAVKIEEGEATRLLELPASELILLGLISNRGMAVIAAIMGLLWQFDLWGLDWGRVADEAPRLKEKIGLSAAPSAVTSILFGLALLVVGVILMKALSVIWSLFRFHGFTLSRRGRDLRARYGLFTRYTATIPTHRIQLLSSRTTPLHRLFHRSGILAETAGGGTGNDAEEQRETHRLWLAPILDASKVETFQKELLPEADLEQAEWTQLPRRAIRRVRNRGFILTVLATIGSVVALGGWGFAIGAVCAGWSVLHARQWWKHAAWAVTPHAVAYKSGWWTRRTSVVRFAKIQTVSVSSTPFDRRLGMARLQVDTAGAGKAGHRLSIPFLPFDAAAGLHGRLAAEAARVGFRW
jgi:putative membrane protein